MCFERTKPKFFNSSLKLGIYSFEFTLFCKINAITKKIILHIKKLFLEIKLNKDKISKLKTIWEKESSNKYIKLFFSCFSDDAIKYVGKTSISSVTILATYTALLKIVKNKEIRKCC